MIARAKKEAKKKGRAAEWENFVNYDKKEGVLFKSNL